MLRTDRQTDRQTDRFAKDVDLEAMPTSIFLNDGDDDDDNDDDEYLLYEDGCTTYQYM